MRVLAATSTAASLRDAGNRPNRGRVATGSGSGTFPAARSAAAVDVRARSGFSLIELLIATSLAAVLSIGVLYVVASFADDVPPEASLPVRRALALLEQDVLGADAAGVAADGAGLMLVGDLTLGEAGRTFRPCRVEWRLEEAAGGQVLVRSQRSPEGETSAKLVLTDVQRLTVATSARTGTDIPERGWTRAFDEDVNPGLVGVFGTLTVGGAAHDFDLKPLLGRSQRTRQ